MGSKEGLAEGAGVTLGGVEEGVGVGSKEGLAGGAGAALGGGDGVTGGVGDAAGGRLPEGVTRSMVPVCGSAV